jgi:membrane peptidoglycan carboxypeptidase
MSIDPATVVAVITALAGLIVALSTRRKADAEINRVTTDAVLSLIKPLNERVAALEGEVATLRQRVAEFRRGVQILCEQVRQLGAEPLWEPPTDDNGD